MEKDKVCYFCGDEEADFSLEEFGSMYEDEFACMTCTDEIETFLLKK